MKKKTYKDTLVNRMKAIEAVVSLDPGMDIEWYGSQPKELKKLSREKLEELFVMASKTLNEVHALSHGYRSKCCRGKGVNLIAPLINAWF